MPQQPRAVEASETPLRISIVIPVLDEEAVIADCLAALARDPGAGIETIVVDGGSRDATRTLAAARADRVLTAPPGRARQMNAGAAAAAGDVLLFLHVDTRLPDGWRAGVAEAVAAGSGWGRFDVRLSGRRFAFRLIEAGMNRRSRLTGVATGDQAMFVRRDVFEAFGGFPDIPLMEDVAMSKRLRRRGRPACLRLRVVTSSRRWEERGIARTVVLMWWLRLAYVLGASPATLAGWYRGRSGSSA